MVEIYVGLMSGTSMDGVDGVLLDFSADSPCVTHAASVPMPDALRAELMALNSVGNDELARAALAANELTRLYSTVVTDLLAQSGRTAKDIRAIGAHGQTVRHQPSLGFTLQLNNASLLAELTGIDVVADFRSRCVAAGGQGAPLAPFFHAAMFSRPTECVAVLNLGGVSNLTVLPPTQSGAEEGLIGFDCGPGNALMDFWCQKHLGKAYDESGAWAASGQIHQNLLKVFLAEPYFALKPPKSTGRDLFNPDWFMAKLNIAGVGTAPPEDIQATLCELTTQSCVRAVNSFAPKAVELLICGGGAYNGHLVRSLQNSLAECSVRSSTENGIPPLQVEAAAFAWLARKTICREALPLASTTGAKGSRILGCVYPA